MILGLPIPLVVIITVALTVLFGFINRDLFKHLMKETDIITFKNRNFSHTGFYTFHFFMMYLPYINVIYFIVLLTILEINNLSKFHR